MNAATITDLDTAAAAISRITDSRNEIFRGQFQVWFTWMDGVLDFHRTQFLFRHATPEELEQHKALLGAAVRNCHLFLALIAPPDVYEPDLVGQLKVRIQQLQDAYDTFHDGTLSDAKAEQVLQTVFPE